MKNLSYIFLFLVLTGIANFSYGQKIDEKLLFSGNGQNNIDAFSYYTDGNGNYAFVEYDNNTNQSRLVSNKGNSDYYDVVNADPKFDRSGNNYTTAYNYRKDTTYLADVNVLLMNGKKVAELATIDSYNAFINSSDQYQTVITDGDKQYIAKFSSDGNLVKTGPYDFVKSIYAEITDAPSTMEGEDKMAQNLFKDKNGNYGYIVIQNGKASIMFGNDVTSTNYTDILETSFRYDKNGTLTYIAKGNGLFYSGYGSEFVVQGDKKWNDFSSVNPPVKFTKDNIPVYTTMDSINENTYSTRLVVGNDYYPVYSNASKTSPVSGYTGGIFDINIADNGNITFSGQTQIISKNPDGYDDYTYKTVNVINGIEGKGYFNQGVIKYSKAGAMLVAGSASQSDKKVSLFMNTGSDSKVVTEKKYDGINDYDFINGGSKFYYVGVTYGDYEKGTKDKSDVYINGDLVGKYENLLGQGTDEGNFNSIIFNSAGDYAFVVQNSNEKKVNGEMTYDYTTDIVSNRDIDSPSLPNGRDKFSYVDNLKFLKNSKLFYVGYLYPTDATMESYLVLDSKILGKPYSSINNLKYNKDNNTITFRASRGNNLYDVTVRL
ncbi:MAG: hypothetical protein JST55_16970 [Bacteroidetes bacterium]|nr:hypothetical protein [Bacteroidota bacterium]